jgi:hypothetical protein
MRDSVLYYPHIEIPNQIWLKNALLFWDHVYRIVPKGYATNDNDEAKMAADAGLLRNIHLEDADFGGIADEFKQFIAGLDFLPAGLDEAEDVPVHPEKIDAQLYPILDQYIDNAYSDDWIHLPRRVARGYMFFLANRVAARRQLDRCTDDKYSYAVAPYFSENANIHEAVYFYDDDITGFFDCPQAAGFYSSLIVRDLLPVDISHIDMKTIMKVATESAEDKVAFRASLYAFAENLRICESLPHARDLFRDYRDALIASKDKLKKTQGLFVSSSVSSLFTMGVPTALTAYSTLLTERSLVGSVDPFSLHVIGPSLAIAAVAAYADLRKAQSVGTNPSGAGYLISIEKQFTFQRYTPRFCEYMEEFIND